MKAEHSAQRLALPVSRLLTRPPVGAMELDSRAEAMDLATEEAVLARPILQLRRSTVRTLFLLRRLSSLNHHHQTYSTHTFTLAHPQHISRLFTVRAQIACCAHPIMPSVSNFFSYIVLCSYIYCSTSPQYSPTSPAYSPTSPAYSPYDLLACLVARNYKHLSLISLHVLIFIIAARAQLTARE